MAVILHLTHRTLFPAQKASQKCETMTFYNEKTFGHDKNNKVGTIIVFGFWEIANVPTMKSIEK